MQTLFNRKDFWVAVVAAVFNLLLFFIGKYQPAYVEDVKYIIGTVDPIIAIVLVALFADAKIAQLRNEVKETMRSLNVIHSDD